MLDETGLKSRLDKRRLRLLKVGRKLVPRGWKGATFGTIGSRHRRRHYRGAKELSEMHNRCLVGNDEAGLERVLKFNNCILDSESNEFL